MYDKQVKPPVAQTKTHITTIHGDTLKDDYFWLRERENPEVVNYLKAENNYLDSMMSHTKGFQKELYDEIKGRIKEDDTSPPYFNNGYVYYTRYEKGKEYPIYCRKKGSETSPEEIMLNVNDLAEGKKFCVVGGMDVSENNQYLFYAVDYSGRNLFNWFVKDLTTGKLLSDTGNSAFGESAWANDNQSFFYVTKDSISLRSNKVWLHKLGTDSKTDKLVYLEKDEESYAGLNKTKSKQYIIISSSYTETYENRFIPANMPTQTPTLIQKKEKGFYYNVDHFGDSFYIITNWQAKNFRLMQTPVTKFDRKNWVEAIPNRPDVLLQGMEIFKDFVVFSERKDGLPQMRICNWNDLRGGTFLDFGEPSYDAYIGANPEINTHTIRYNYTSLTTPSSTIDYNIDTKERKVIKEAPVLGDFNKTDYVTERLVAIARDGVKVPISLVYKKGFKKDGTAPMLLYSYGSYGSSSDPYFSVARLSLLNRGFCFAIAHIRGGQEMGYEWYENGKLMKKKNTFNDFIDCAEFLTQQKYTSKEKLFAMGGSAGGLLMGAIANMRPDLFRGIVAGVPFVDVINTMMDSSIPLTTGEYQEWGNPNIKEEYLYMKSYSPYDNVKKQAYPAILITTGLSDSQVQYWEPAKWVAKLRVNKTDNNPLLMFCNLDAGHGGASGRFERIKQTAMEYAFMLDLLKDTKINN
ncbi:MAG: S9 family peptidase [Saprospiraceae bacterium]|nr:S9 family peptidase [Saprospiraceae bacterium]